MPSAVKKQVHFDDKKSAKPKKAKIVSKLAGTAGNSENKLTSILKKKKKAVVAADLSKVKDAAVPKKKKKLVRRKEEENEDVPKKKKVKSVARSQRRADKQPEGIPIHKIKSKEDKLAALENAPQLLVLASPSQIMLPLLQARFKGLEAIDFGDFKFVRGYAKFRTTGKLLSAILKGDIKVWGRNKVKFLEVAADRPKEGYNGICITDAGRIIRKLFCSADPPVVVKMLKSKCIKIAFTSQALADETLKRGFISIPKMGADIQFPVSALRTTGPLPGIMVTTDATFACDPSKPLPALLTGIPVGQQMQLEVDPRNVLLRVLKQEFPDLESIEFNRQTTCGWANFRSLEAAVRAIAAGEKKVLDVPVEFRINKSSTNTRANAFVVLCGKSLLASVLRRALPTASNLIAMRLVHTPRKGQETPEPVIRLAFQSSAYSLKTKRLRTVNILGETVKISPVTVEMSLNLPSD